MFIITLPFAKGKTFEYILLPKQLVPEFALYDVGYYFILTPSLIFLLISIYIGIRSWKTGNIKKTNIKSIVLFILVLLCTIPSLFNSQFQTIIELSILQLFLMGIIFILPILLHIKIETIKYLEHILAAFMIFESIWVFLQYIHRGPLGRFIESVLDLNKFGVTPNENNFLLRLSGTFFESSILGTFMLMHVFYFAEVLLSRKNILKIEKKIYITSIICAFLSIILTASRGIYVLFIIAGIIFCFVHRLQLFGKISNRNITKFVVFIFGITVFPFTQYLFIRFQSILTIFSQGGSGDFRLTLMQYAIRVAQTHLFGVGLNISSYVFAIGFPSERVYDPALPHNIFFQILAELGAPGLIVFLLFLWIVYRKYTTYKGDKTPTSFIASLMFILCAQFYPIFISQPEISSFFFLHLGLMIWSIDSQKKYNA